MSDVIVYSIGIVCASACAPSAMDRDEIERQVNADHPTGIASRWTISSDEEFADGIPNGTPCEQRPETHRHWLLTC